MSCMFQVDSLSYIKVYTEAARLAGSNHPMSTLCTVHVYTISYIPLPMAALMAWAG